jgi:hypothetical protein
MDKDSYEAVLFNHDFQKETLTLALSIVKKFIIDHKRKLVGGMGIDFALRSKGTKLYPDDKLPDYDFITPEFHHDAYHIGELLVAAGIQNVSVIRAYHVSTMRVRVNYISVADSSYVPVELYNKIPVLLCNDIHIVHPHWQVLDQYRALSLPFENPPMESMMNRWKKDMERNSLLMESFPIDYLTDPVSSATVKIDHNLLINNCLHGVAALAYWAELAKPLGFDTLLSYGDNVTLNGCPLEIYSNDFTKCLVYLDGEHKYYNATLDKIPRYVQCNDIRIYDNTHRLMSAVNVGKYHVAGLMAVACHLGTKWLLYNDTHAKNNYHITLRLISFACDKYTIEKNEVIKNLLPITTVYGTSNISESYELQLLDADSRISNIKQVIAVPKNAYPSNTKKIPLDYYDFKPETSTWYMFDGKLCVRPFKLRA